MRQLKSIIVLLTLVLSFGRTTAIAGQQPEDVQWRSHWISANSGEKPVNLWTCYRKQFTLGAKPAAAIARIAVDSHYWLWVNGQPVVFEGGLKRGPTPGDTYFDEVDLAPYLVAGPNTIAVLHWYFGKDGYSFKSSGNPGFLFEMDADGVAVDSDKTWKAKIHPAYGPSIGKKPNYRLAESPIFFDARLDLGDWTAAGYDDSSWANAVELGEPPTAPWNHLYGRPIPQWKNFGLAEYTNAAELPAVSDGHPIAAKLPYNAQITAWLKVDAPAGLAIDMHTDDKLCEIHSDYITRDGVQAFEGLAWMNGHTVIYDMPAGIKILGLKYRQTGFDTEFTGAFHCDQDFFNKLWGKSRRTLYVTMRDNFMDCPDRERGQWWGDAVNEIGETFYALSPSSHLLARKAIYNLTMWQHADKTLFSPVPSGNYVKNQELPTQMLASVGKYGFWNYYLNTGDQQTLRDAYPHVKDYLSIWKLDADGLVAHRKGGWDWEDWGKEIDARVLDNAWFCLALEGAANMAEVVGDSQQATEYRQERKAIIAAVNAHFWDGTAYRTPTYKGDTDDRANALAVVAGIADAAKFSAIEKVLAEQFNASPYMEKYVLEALALMGTPEAALERMQKRYSTIVASPLTTLPELWHGGTDNHAWSGGPLTILSQYIGGIAPLTPGFATYQVRPEMGSLTQIAETVDTVRGKIELEIETKPEETSLTLTSPASTLATISVPNRGGTLNEVDVNGKTAWKAGESSRQIDGLAIKESSLGEPELVASPGHWTIRFGWTVAAAR